MPHLRPPAVAGQFYPEEPEELRSAVEHFLRAWRPLDCPAAALIVPHAGYAYSGCVAGAGYACLSPEHRREIRRVSLLGTAHSPGAVGLVTSLADGFVTPLGTVPIDRSAVASVLDLPQVKVDEAMHARDHSLEVQLPFLQVLLPGAAVVPFLVGSAEVSEVVEVLERLWRPEDTLVVVSADLSHYHDAHTARDLDRRTAEAIRTLRAAEMDPGRACGFHAIRGLLTFAGQHDWRVVFAELKNSGDTAGTQDRVVGYGSFVFSDPPGAKGCCTP